MNDIIRIMKSLENSGVLFYGVSKTLKREIIKKRKWIFWYSFMNCECINVLKYVNR